MLALLLLFAIFKYINISARQKGPLNVTKAKGNSKTGTNWGDVFDSVRYKLTTAILAKVTGSENFHAKNWRPQLLTFVDTDEEGVPLSSEVLALASQFQGGRGLNIVVSIKQGSYLRKGTYEFAQHCNETLKESMSKERLQVSGDIVRTTILQKKQGRLIQIFPGVLQSADNAVKIQRGSVGSRNPRRLGAR